MVFSKIFGTKSEREIKKLSSTIDKINQSYKLLSEKTDEELIKRTAELKDFVINARNEKIKLVESITTGATNDGRVEKGLISLIDLGATHLKDRESPSISIDLDPSSCTMAPEIAT